MIAPVHLRELTEGWPTSCGVCHGPIAVLGVELSTCVHPEMETDPWRKPGRDGVDRIDLAMAWFSKAFILTRFVEKRNHFKVYYGDVFEKKLYFRT